MDSNVTVTGTGSFSGAISTTSPAKLENPTLTFGQQLVGVRFNPSGMDKVDVVKQFFAQAIDDIQETPAEGYLQNTVKGQAIRELATACMWAVKFHTLGK